MVETDKLQACLHAALETAKKNSDGKVASYIPELAAFPEEYTRVSVRLMDNAEYHAGDSPDQKLTLQSVGKLVVLIGLLEEIGPKKLNAWVRMEPSGDDFASVARLDQFGPVPSNPMLNAGAIGLCGAIEGNAETRLAWLEKWMQNCFESELHSNLKVFTSERRTGDRNRALAYLLKSNGVISGDVDDILDTYFHLCSFEVTVETASKLAFLLANMGVNANGEQIISRTTVRHVISIMATCGLYNESGRHLVRTGMPGKSSVSGLILAVLPGVAGIAVASPRVNRKGTSIRGELMLETISEQMNWHFVNTLNSC